MFRSVLAIAFHLGFSDGALTSLLDQNLGHPLTQSSLMREEVIINTLLNPLVQSTEQDLFLNSNKNWLFDFLLYTRRDSSEDGYQLTPSKLSLDDSNFNADKPLKIIVHGWTDSSESFWVQQIRRAYLEVGDYNVICVNWYPASNTEYLYAVELTRKVGDQLATLLQFLQEEAELSLENVHLLGHSLGAQIAGFAGTNLGGGIGRITGLDPAKPLFENLISLQSTPDYLDWSDAIFVDVIHTCAGTLGFATAVGHVDFYPNGGTAAQPGCPFLTAQSCSHERSYEYMIESIKHPKSFISMRCDSWGDYVFGFCNDYSRAVYMGEKVDVDANGIYYLETNPSYPFGKGR